MRLDEGTWPQPAFSPETLAVIAEAAVRSLNAMSNAMEGLTCALREEREAREASALGVWGRGGNARQRRGARRAMGLWAAQGVEVRHGD